MTPPSTLCRGWSRVQAVCTHRHAPVRPLLRETRLGPLITPLSRSPLLSHQSISRLLIKVKGGTSLKSCCEVNQPLPPSLPTPRSPTRRTACPTPALSAHQTVSRRSSTSCAGATSPPPPPPPRSFCERWSTQGSPPYLLPAWDHAVCTPRTHPRSPIPTHTTVYTSRPHQGPTSPETWAW